MSNHIANEDYTADDYSRPLPWEYHDGAIWDAKGRCVGDGFTREIAEQVITSTTFCAGFTNEQLADGDSLKVQYLIQGNMAEVLKDVRDDYTELRLAAKEVIARWESGDLAEAVRALAVLVED